MTRGSRFARGAERVLRHVELREASGREEWTTVAGQQAGFTPFHAWDWLEWVAPLVHCRFLPLLVVDEGGVAVGAAPTLLKRRGPFHTANWVPFPYLGPLVPPDFLGATLGALRRLGRKERLTLLQIAAHPFALTPLDSRATYASYGIDLHLDQTYIVPLEGRDLAEIRRGLSRTAERKLRRASAEGVELRPSTPDEIASLLPQIEVSALARQGQGSAYSDELGDKLLSRPATIPLRIVSAVHEGATVGVLAALGGPISALWMGGILDHKDTNANVALYWDAIVWAHASGSNFLDMVGIPNAGISAYKRQFGGVLYTYPVGRRHFPMYQHLQRLEAGVRSQLARRHLP